MPGITHRSDKPALLKTTFLSHGTLTVRDLATSRRFYEEVLGFEVVQQAPMALFIRLGGDHVLTCVETPAADMEMPLLNHNGVDLPTRADVDQAYETLLSVREEYGIRKLTRPARQHGTYAFYMQDLDGNWWEICHLPPGGYAFRFRDPRFDLTGRTDLSKEEIQRIYQNAMDEVDG